MRRVPLLRAFAVVVVPPALLLAACHGDSSGSASDSATSGESTSTTADTTTTTTGTTTTTSAGTATTTSTSTGETTTTTTTTTTTSTTTTTESTTTTTGPLCEDGEIVCSDEGAQVCKGGVLSEPDPCAEACEPGLGCVLCSPGDQACDGDDAIKCAPDGQSWVPTDHCDPVQGIFCNPDFGACDGDCAPDNLQLDYLGCEYYPVITAQLDGWNEGTKIFAVTVANTADVVTDVLVTRGDADVAMVQVQPGSVTMIPLPWIPELTKGTGPTKVVKQGAYRLRANHPVTVFQFNPLLADFTNDASLLLPVNAWTESAMVASWPHWTTLQEPKTQLPGFYAVIATEDDTKVTLQPSATGKKVQAGAGVKADGSGSATLNRGDVLEVFSADGGDLTGTRVSATKAVEVIAGHKCTNVPADIDACDHLEEAMTPLIALSKSYIVAPPVQSPNDKLEKGQIVRVIASEDDTTLTFTPDQMVATNLAKAGDFVELPPGAAKYRVEADKRIMVVQYMVGQAGGYGNSDPAMFLTVAVDQYRDKYLFHAPPTWSANYVDVIAPDGAQVTVDAKAVSNFVSIPGTGYGLAHVKLDNQGDGNHEVSSNQKVGIGVYGVQSFGSYWTVGGLDLEHF
ncbi:MAG: IgGFc-binding protein [Nannocystaceae bacterium]